MNIETMRLLVAKGLSAEDLLEVAETMAVKVDRTAAERQARHRAKVKAERDDVTRDVTRDSNDTTPLSRPPNEINSNPPTHTPPDMTTRARAGNRNGARPVRTAGVDHPMPDGWEPLLTERSQKIVDGWPPGMWARELSKFRNHAADKGRVSKDWQAAFRTWIDNAEERRTANGHSHQTFQRSGGASPDKRSGLARAVDDGIAHLDAQLAEIRGRA